MTSVPNSTMPTQILATDLDGTLIPLDGNVQNRADLQDLSEALVSKNVPLVFSTGRHFESVLHVIKQFQLPTPNWIVCDVGTSIFTRQPTGGFELVAAYHAHLDQIVGGTTTIDLRKSLQSIQGLRPQEDEKQGRFKLSYYTQAETLADRVHEIQCVLDRINAQYSIVDSVDPFNGDGLIDLLPAGVSKAHALTWWSAHAGLPADAIVFAGDSGNDLAALTAGFRAIVVGNADRMLAKQVYQAHQRSGWQGRLFLATGHATTGVLQGCRWFGLADQGPARTGQLGATPISNSQTHFRVWAPKRHSVAVEVRADKDRVRHLLRRSEFGYFSGTVSGVGSGSDYQYVLDGHTVRPDPASRFQPEGVHGVSRISDPQAYPWTDQAWRGVAKRELIVYELHIGAFTDAGTFSAAGERLDELVELGITAVEIMPVAQSPGRWNWGYDGVDLFAVRNTYGGPDAFKALVDLCHAKGIAVILDVVYNHLGPEGNYLADFGPYFSTKHRTPWGEALNFDGRHSDRVRQFIIDNAIYWLDEYHLDGLRIDAIHFMIDDRQPAIIDDLRKAVTDFSHTVQRTIHLIAESNTYNERLLTENEHRAAYDAIWCDCFMHSIYCFSVRDLRLTQREYRGAADLFAALRQGYVYTGPTPLRVAGDPPDRDGSICGMNRHIESLVIALQTHDAVGNHPHGKRLHQLTSKAFQRAAASLLLLYPGIPMVFMGEETCAANPFPFFADFEDRRLRSAVDRGRTREHPQHDWRNAPLPSAPESFYSAKCQASRQADEEMFAWYRSLISFRKLGLAEGWLTPSRFTADYDGQLRLFTLNYACPSGGTVAVRVRLSEPDIKHETPAHVSIEGELLLSSELNAERGPTGIQLMPNHAIVTRTR